MLSFHYSYHNYTQVSKAAVRKAYECWKENRHYDARVCNVSNRCIDTRINVIFDTVFPCDALDDQIRQPHLMIRNFGRVRRDDMSRGYDRLFPIITG